MTPKETSADALTDEQKKRIASIVHTDCTLIPGATFYNAAELAIAETLAALPVPVDKPAPSPADERAAFDLRDVLSDTGNPEADRLIGRLTSADPDFNDCTDAAVFIRRIVAEHRGPDGFATWKDAALAERMRRVQSKPSTETLRSLFIEAMDFGIGFGPRLSQVGEWADARDLKADGFVARAASANETGAEGALGYAQRLATGLWEKHWRDSAPQWKVLDDMLGVLTQIDNMVCGLSRSPAMAAEADDDAPDIATFCELLGSYGRVMSSRDFPNDERYAAREDVINAYRAALRETAGDAPATSAEAVAIHQAIHQVWIEETSSWADVTPAYYAERQPSNRRRVYYAPQPPAQADAIAEIDPPQAGGNKGRLPALARTREGHNLYSLGYNRGLKKGRDEPAQADARVGLTDEQQSPAAATPTTEYSYANVADAERWHGQFDSISAAIAEALGEYGNDPDRIVYVGENKPVEIYYDSLADEVVERVEEQVYEQVGEVADTVGPFDVVQMKPLADSIKQWVEQNAAITCWRVENIKGYGPGAPEYEAARALLNGANHGE